jgi:hypothetical protein
MPDPFEPQRQRHGVTKNLVEGLGGVIVGAAAVLLLRRWLRPHEPAAAPAGGSAGADAAAGSARAGVANPRSRSTDFPEGGKQPSANSPEEESTQ